MFAHMEISLKKVDSGLTFCVVEFRSQKFQYKGFLSRIFQKSHDRIGHTIDLQLAYNSSLIFQKSYDGKVSVSS